MLGGSASFRAKQFVTEANKSTMVYEVKRVRAVWDPSLSIPGTDRRGGWRCPEGTRYGGQITDRFGRQCGWGLVRRIANMVSNVGESLEDRDDRRRGRRGGKRRVTPDATPELDTPDLNLTNDDSALAESLGESIPTPTVPKPRTVKPRRVTNIDTPEAVEPKPEPRPRRAPRRRPQGNLRPSEQRRMERELEQPGAPRTGLEEPSVEQVLTPEQASDAIPTEEFRPYVLRKYNEYARNVRKIREEGGDAGMLTRREWYALNKDNLRSAWKDVHGTDAPDSFEPPTPQPRRPRRRRQRAVEESASTRSPSLRNDKEPVAVEPKPEPKKPSRPKKPSSVRPTGAQEKPRKPAPPTPPDWVKQANGRWKIGDWRITASEDENGNFLRFVASTPDMRYAEGVSVDEVVMAMNSEDDLFNAPREVDWNNLLEAQGIFQIGAYLNDQVIGKRTEILNDADNFPVVNGVAGDADFADFQMSVENNIQQARQTRQAIQKLIRDGNIREQDFWLDRNDVARDMESVLDWLEEVEDAWLYVQSSNKPEPSPFQLGSGWNKIGDNKWDKGGIELELGFVNGEVVSAQIKNPASGEIFEQEFRADQSQVQNFVDNLYAMIGGREVLTPKKLRKKGRFIDEAQLLEMERDDRAFIKFSLIPDLGMGIGYANGAEMQKQLLQQMIQRSEVGYVIDQHEIESVTQLAYGIRNNLERIEELKKKLGLSDSDYFDDGSGSTISIGEIKRNFNALDSVIKEQFQFMKENYFTEDRLREFFDLSFFITHDEPYDQAGRRRNLLKFLLLNDFKDFSDIVKLHGEEQWYDPQSIIMKRIKEMSQFETHQRMIESIQNGIFEVMTRDIQFAKNEMDFIEILEELGLPNEIDTDSLEGLDEMVDATKKEITRIQNAMADIGSKLQDQNISIEEKTELVANVLKLDAEKHFYNAIKGKLIAKRMPLDEIRRADQRSFDRDAAIARFFDDPALNDVDGTDIRKFLEIAERANYLLSGARGADRNDEFENPAGILGRTMRDLDDLLSAIPEDEQMKKLQELLADSESSVDQVVKQLNDAIEKFRISPTRKNLAVLRSQAIEAIKVKANVQVEKAKVEELNKPHRLNMRALQFLEHYINERSTAYDAIGARIREIFEKDLSRYSEGELIHGNDIDNAVAEMRRSLREAFKLMRPSPASVDRLNEMAVQSQEDSAEARSIFNAIAEELRGFLPSGDVDADKAKAQEIAQRLSVAAKIVAVNAVRQEELFREFHTKRSEVSTRQIPQNPVQILFGGKFEDHADGINTDNIEQRINSVIGEISDRRIAKYISDIDDAYALLDKFDDEEIIRFPNGDIKVEDARKALVESSRVYQEVRNARANDPNRAIFTPRESGREELTDEQLKINPVTQLATSGSEVDIAKVQEAVGLISLQDIKRRLVIGLQEASLAGDLQKVQNIQRFVNSLENFMNGLNIDGAGENLDVRERDELLMKVDYFIKEMTGIRAEDIEDITNLIQVKRNKMSSNVAKMDDLKKQLADSEISMVEFNAETAKLADEYTRDLLGITDSEDKIAIYNWAKSEVPKMVERRIRGLGINDESVLEPLSDDELEQVDRKITSQIKKGIARRLEVLQNYINERYPTDQSERPWEQMTPEIWDSLSIDKKKEYIQKAYSHERIVGTNGILYNAVATVGSRDGDYLQVNVIFNEIDADGNEIREAGNSERAVNVSSGYVDNKYMVLGRRSPIDKNAGIQTIYNQHAFMYLSQIGINEAHVATMDDGPYVWARIGFIQEERLYDSQMESIEKILRRYESIGPVGIIGSDAEYKRIAALYKMWERGADVSHQDFIFAFDSTDKFRALRQKEWFRSNFGLGSGVLNFASQFVTSNPGEAAQNINAQLQSSNGGRN